MNPMYVFIESQCINVILVHSVLDKRQWHTPFFNLRGTGMMLPRTSPMPFADPGSQRHQLRRIQNVFTTWLLGIVDPIRSDCSPISISLLIGY